MYGQEEDEQKGQIEEYICLILSDYKKKNLGQKYSSWQRPR